MKTCKIAGCERDSVVCDYCMAHYQRYRNGKRGAALDQPIEEYRNALKKIPCFFESCNELAVIHGCCKKHYQASYNHEYYLKNKERIKARRKAKAEDERV